MLLLNLWDWVLKLWGEVLVFSRVFSTVGGNFPDELRAGLFPVVPLENTENYLRSQSGAAAG